MNAHNNIELAVEQWSGWAPGLSSKSDWRRWATGQQGVQEEGKPNVTFVKPLLRRKLSQIARMAFHVASDCLSNDDFSPEYVFCSRYGDYGRTYRILDALTNDEPVSALAFSMSVHNASSSMFSINKKDTANSTSLAAGDATLENAFVEAWARLSAREVDSVLIVYHDEPLPEIYAQQNTSIHFPHAAAFLVTLPNSSNTNTRITLGWSKNGQDVDVPSASSALRLLQMILTKSGPQFIHTERLCWEWSQSSETP